MTDPVSGYTASTNYTLDSVGNIQSATLSGTNATTQPKTYTPLDSWGRPTQLQDGRGYVTKYSYSDSWADSTCAPSTNSNAYLTSVTNAANQTTSYKYYSCTGLLASVTDPNSQTTRYTYDALGRVTNVSYPDGGSTTNSYTDTAPNSIETTVAQSAGVNQVRNVVLDGLSRKSQTQLLSDPTGADYVDTTYDAIGRVASVSNPYRTQPSPTTQYY